MARPPQDHEHNQISRSSPRSHVRVSTAPFPADSAPGPSPFPDPVLSFFRPHKQLKLGQTQIELPTFFPVSSWPSWTLSESPALKSQLKGC